jgi:hypothetical protein
MIVENSSESQFCVQYGMAFLPLSRSANYDYHLGAHLVGKTMRNERGANEKEKT